MRLLTLYLSIGWLLVGCSAPYHHQIKYAADLTSLCSEANLLVVKLESCQCLALTEEAKIFSYRFDCPQFDYQVEIIKELYNKGLACTKSGGMPKLTEDKVFSCEKE